MVTSEKKLECNFFCRSNLGFHLLFTYGYVFVGPQPFVVFIENQSRLWITSNFTDKSDSVAFLNRNANFMLHLNAGSYQLSRYRFCNAYKVSNLEQKSTTMYLNRIKMINMYVYVIIIGIFFFGLSNTLYAYTVFL